MTFILMCEDEKGARKNREMTATSRNKEKYLSGDAKSIAELPRLHEGIERRYASQWLPMN